MPCNNGVCKLRHFVFRNYSSVKPETLAAKMPHEYSLLFELSFRLNRYVVTEYEVLNVFGLQMAVAHLFW